MVMGPSRLKRKDESLIALDLGSTTARLIQIKGDRPNFEIAAFACAPMAQDIFSGSAPSKPEKAAEAVSALLNQAGVTENKAVIALPSAAVFTRRITVPALGPKELMEHIKLEAGNFIPHPVEAISLDFQVIGPSGRNELDVLVAAVKKDLVDKYLECLSLAGLETVLVDVDCFALQNAFETCCPDYLNKTIALVNIGGRFTSFNVCSGGVPLFTGDISVGGKYLTDILAAALGLEFSEAERLKKSGPSAGGSPGALDVLAKGVEHIAGEIRRQLAFFAASAGDEKSISHIKLSGGGSRTTGLAAALSEKMAVPCSDWSPLGALRIGSGVNSALIKENAAAIAVLTGLGLRRLGDKTTQEP